MGAVGPHIDMNGIGQRYLFVRELGTFHSDLLFIVHVVNFTSRSRLIFAPAIWEIHDLADRHI